MCLLVGVACFHLNVSLAAKMTSLNFVTSKQKSRNIRFPSKTSHQAINGSKSLSYEKSEHTWPRILQKQDARIHLWHTKEEKDGVHRREIVNPSALMRDVYWRCMSRRELNMTAGNDFSSLCVRSLLQTCKTWAKHQFTHINNNHLIRETHSYVSLESCH